MPHRLDALDAAVRESTRLVDVQRQCRDCVGATQVQSELRPGVGTISASRRVEAPSRHRRDSSSSEKALGVFLFEFERIRTASSDRDAPRRL